MVKGTLGAGGVAVILIQGRAPDVGQKTEVLLHIVPTTIHLPLTCTSWRDHGLVSDRSSNENRVLDCFGSPSLTCKPQAELNHLQRSLPPKGPKANIKNTTDSHQNYLRPANRLADPTPKPPSLDSNDICKGPNLKKRPEIKTTD